MPRRVNGFAAMAFAAVVLYSAGTRPFSDGVASWLDLPAVRAPPLHKGVRPGHRVADRPPSHRRRRPTWAPRMPSRPSIPSLAQPPLLEAEPPRVAILILPIAVIGWCLRRRSAGVSGPRRWAAVSTLATVAHGAPDDIHCPDAPHTAVNGALIGGTPTSIEALRGVVERHAIDAAALAARCPDALHARPEVLATALEYLTAVGVDVAVVAKRHPRTLLNEVGALEAGVTFLRGLGLDARRIGTRRPDLLTAPLPSLEAKVALLQEAGVDVPRVVTALPSALGYHVDRLRWSVEYLRAVGLPIPLFINRNPSCLAYSPDRLQATVRLLQDHRLPVPRVAAGLPLLFGLKLASVQAVLDFLWSMPLDARRLVLMRPQLLAGDVAGMRAVLRALQSLGLDPAAVVHRCPAVLETETADLVDKVTFYTGKLVGGTLEEIDASPRYLIHSFRHRIRPRYRYLRTLGLPWRRPDVVLDPPDAGFADTVARSTLDLYTRWRKVAGV